VKNIHRIGAMVSKRLSELGIFTAKDLLFYFPFRYDDLSHILPIKEAITAGGPARNATQSVAGGLVTIKCVVEMIESHRSPRRHKLFTEALVSDDSGKIKVIWFNQPFMARVLAPGDKVYFSGKINADFFGAEMINPVYEKISQSAAWKKEAIHTGRIVPIYPLTERLSQKQLRFLINLVLPFAREIVDPLPVNLRRNLNLLEIASALELIHFPKNQEQAEQAAKRFKFEELFYLQLENETSRLELKQENAPKIKFFETETREFVANLPFQLTGAQRKSAWEILTDLGAKKIVIARLDRAIQKKEMDSRVKPENDKSLVSPMNRLLNGDVGSGKTIVAALAIFNVLKNNFQAAFMAPTEILASQHFLTFSKLFKNLDVKICLLTRGFSQICEKGAIKRVSKKKILEGIKNGEIGLALGTHALIEEKIKFNHLALAIVDEQHRFGVKARAALRDRDGNPGLTPHFLSMTATPIPRTLSLIAYGDLDISLLNEMPKGRKLIVTKLVLPDFKADSYSFIRHEIKSGRQAFVICPLIDPSDKLGVRSVKEEFEKLKNEIFPEFKIEVLHGKMKSAEKNKIMDDFKSGETQILVSTTVVEVGVDVPNASLMIIEGAERFGLAQLHQLRGRVGRGEHQSYCLVFLESASGETSRRLKIFANTLNGFELAEYDLKFRGPGDVLGIRQSGLPTLKMARLDDIELLKTARDEAKKFVAEDPEFKKAPLLRRELEKRRGEKHLE